jgi:hypothetical protein
MLLESITAIAAKIAGANTVAQAAAGLGIAVAGVTGAGAAGILPGPVQDGVAGAIEAVSPFEAPDSGDVTAPVRPTDVTPVVSTEAPVPAAVTATPTVTAAEPTETRHDDGQVEDGAHHDGLDDGEHEDGAHHDGQVEDTHHDGLDDGQHEDHEDDHSGHGGGGDDSGSDDSGSDHPESDHSGGDSSGHGGGDD